MATAKDAATDVTIRVTRAISREVRAWTGLSEQPPITTNAVAADDPGEVFFDGESFSARVQSAGPNPNERDDHADAPEAITAWQDLRGRLQTYLTWIQTKTRRKLPHEPMGLEHLSRHLAQRLQPYLYLKPDPAAVPFDWALLEKADRAGLQAGFVAMSLDAALTAPKETSKDVLHLRDHLSLAALADRARQLPKATSSKLDQPTLKQILECPVLKPVWDELKESFVVALENLKFPAQPKFTYNFNTIRRRINERLESSTVGQCEVKFVTSQIRDADVERLLATYSTAKPSAPKETLATALEHLVMAEARAVHASSTKADLHAGVEEPSEHNESSTAMPGNSDPLIKDATASTRTDAPHPLQQHIHRHRRDTGGEFSHSIFFTTSIRDNASREVLDDSMCKGSFEESLRQAASDKALGIDSSVWDGVQHVNTHRPYGQLLLELSRTAGAVGEAVKAVRQALDVPDETLLRGAQAASEFITKSLHGNTAPKTQDPSREPPCWQTQFGSVYAFDKRTRTDDSARDMASHIVQRLELDRKENPNSQVADQERRDRRNQRHARPAGQDCPSADPSAEKPFNIAEGFSKLCQSATAEFRLLLKSEDRKGVRSVVDFVLNRHATLPKKPSRFDATQGHATYSYAQKLTLDAQSSIGRQKTVEILEAMLVCVVLAWFSPTPALGQWWFNLYLDTLLNDHRNDRDASCYLNEIRKCMNGAMLSFMAVSTQDAESKTMHNATKAATGGPAMSPLWFLGHCAVQNFNCGRGHCCGRRKLVYIPGQTRELFKDALVNQFCSVANYDARKSQAYFVGEPGGDYMTIYPCLYDFFRQYDYRVGLLLGTIHTSYIYHQHDRALRGKSTPIGREDGAPPSRRVRPTAGLSETSAVAPGPSRLRSDERGDGYSSDLDSSLSHNSESQSQFAADPRVTETQRMSIDKTDEGRDGREVQNDNPSELWPPGRGSLEHPPTSRFESNAPRSSPLTSGTAATAPPIPTPLTAPSWSPIQDGTPAASVPRPGSPINDPRAPKRHRLPDKPSLPDTIAASAPSVDPAPPASTSALTHDPPAPSAGTGPSMANRGAPPGTENGRTPRPLRRQNAKPPAGPGRRRG